ncbi:MAG: 30S ribosomal protein S4, partial [Stackebrandtia sp.]
PRSRDKAPFQLAAAGAWATGGPTPAYLETTLPELRARLVAEPPRSQVPVLCDEQLVVEFYSR